MVALPVAEGLNGTIYNLTHQLLVVIPVKTHHFTLREVYTEEYKYVNLILIL